VPLTTSLYMTLCRAAYFTRTNSFQDALDNPPESCSVNFERDCPEEGCIVSAIANYSSRALQQNITLLEQQNALKFIIHFVGDIHQPLHVENLALGCTPSGTLPFPRRLKATSRSPTRSPGPPI
jgi:hypothetical protein